MTEGGDTGNPVSTSHAQGVHTPAFRRLWWSWTVSLLGDGVRGLALPLYVAVKTGSPLAASAVVAAEVLPWLLFALPAGAIVDRARPKVVVTVAHLFRAAATAGLVACILTDNATVPVLCAFAFVLTVAETFSYAASQSLMVSLAGPDQLNEANAKFYTVHTIGMNLAGPLAAGALFVIGPAWAFALDGATFLVAAALVIRLPATAVVRSAAEPRRTKQLTADIREGISMLFGIYGLRILVSMIAVVTLAFSAVNALSTLFAVDVLDMPESLVPTLMVAGALGTLLGTRVVTAAVGRWPEGRVLVTSLVVMAVGMATYGMFPVVGVALAANALIGVGVGAFNVLAAARRQRLTPPTAVGRISGAYRMVAWGLMPIGAALAGPLAVTTSIGSVFVIVGGVILVALLFLARPLLRTGGQSTPRRDSTADDSRQPTSPPATS
jgi:MFS family permease